MITSITYNDLYQRQINLIGDDAQQRLKASRVLVVGMGGLGHPVVQYLASSGLGYLTLVDYDHVSVTNLQRQILFAPQDIGRYKVDVVAERLQKLAPFCHISSYRILLNHEYADELIKDHDIVIDCTDNFKTKFFLNDYCHKYKKKFVSASVYQQEGQVYSFDFTQENGPCLRCLWPSEPLDGCTKTCAEAGVWGPLLGAIGSAEAMAALKMLTTTYHAIHDTFVLWDIYSLEQTKIKFFKNRNCLCCSQQEYSKGDVKQKTLEMINDDFIIIDIRSPVEVLSEPLPKVFDRYTNILSIPTLELESFVWDSSKQYLLICSRGLRSLKAVSQFESVCESLYSLAGGINSYRS